MARCGYDAVLNKEFPARIGEVAVVDGSPNEQMIVRI
jgi:hypothetical protein